MATKTLLNECRACNMKFENSEQLNNHIKKFCQGSDYSDMQKLQEKIYAKEIRDLRLSKGLINDQNMQEVDERKRKELKVAGQMSLADLKEKIKLEDQEFKRLEKLSEKNRQGEQEEEINKLREERAKIRLEKKEDEQKLEELIRKLEIKKEKELKQKIEKDQIRRALVDIEKAKLQTIGQEKKRELDQIVAEREAIRQKEEEVMKEIEDLEQNQQQLDQMRQEEVQKMQKAIDSMGNQTKENKNVNMAMVQERAEKVTALQMRREQLEMEKERLNKNLGHLKNGEFHLMKKDGFNFAAISAKNLIGDMKDLENYNIPGVREKLQRNKERIEELKRKQNNQSYLPYEGIELLNKQGNRELSDNVAAYYDDLQKKSQITPEGMEFFRNNLDNMARNKEINNSRLSNASNINKSNYNQNKLTDLKELKNDYIKNGGQDPQFVKEMNNLQDFYQREIPQTNQNTQKLDLNNGPPSLEKQNNIQITPNFQNQTSPYTQPQIQYQQPQQGQTLNIHIPPVLNSNNIPQYSQQQQQQFQQQQFQQQQMQPNIQQAIDIGNQQNMYGQGFTLGQMMGGKQSDNPFGIFAAEKEAFLQNAQINPNLQDEEKVLFNLAAQEVDQLRVLSRLPVGSELYRLKMEQFKELSQTRVEIEKIVQEQRLQRVKRDFDRSKREDDRRSENERWIDDQRKFLISQSLRGDNNDENNYNNNNNNYNYNPNYQSANNSRSFNVNNNDQGYKNQNYHENNGLVIHWDYILGLPQRQDYCQLVFGVYNNQDTLFSPKLVDAQDCEPQSSKITRCIFNDKHQIFQIKKSNQTILVVEVQLPYSKRIEESVGRTESFGWTIINLFDIKNYLNRGKWKLPIFYGPTDPQIDFNNISRLKQIQDAWIYIRIAQPDDRDFGDNKRVYPESTQHEYQIPRLLQDGQLNLNELNNQSYQPSMNENNQRQRRPGSNRSNYSRGQYSDILDQSENNNDSNNNRGIEVTVQNINNYISRSYVKVMIAIMENKQPILDDNSMACLFNTSLHNPQSTIVNPITDVKEFNQQNPQLFDISNKQEGLKINYYEKYKFYTDLKKKYKKNQQNLYLGIQVVENQNKQLNSSILQQSKISYDMLDFDVIGWNFIPLNKYDGTIISGQLKDVTLYKPKIRSPPVDPTRLQKSDITINLNLDLFQYSQQQLNNAQQIRLQNISQNNSNNNFN